MAAPMAEVRGGRAAASEAAGGGGDLDGYRYGSLGGGTESGIGRQVPVSLPWVALLSVRLGFDPVLGSGGGLVDESVTLWWSPPLPKVVGRMFRW
jgi:hypothetical protein